MAIAGKIGASIRGLFKSLKTNGCGILDVKKIDPLPGILDLAFSYPIEDIPTWAVEAS
jgi:hypothetical protein